VRGWGNYFSLGPVSKAYRAVDAHTRYRLRQWLRYKNSRKEPDREPTPTSIFMSNSDWCAWNGQRAKSLLATVCAPSLTVRCSDADVPTLQAYVEGGGTLVFGCWSGYRDRNHWCYDAAGKAFYENLVGARVGRS
jgi:glycosyl hydrolase family 42 (putative beta-galactosidase)/group II intron maturase